MSNKPKLILPGTSEHNAIMRTAGRSLLLPSTTGSTGRVRVRNANGQALPCCWSDCEAEGDNRHRVEVDHNAPKFPGEKLVYIFCGAPHRQLYLAGTPYANR